MSTALRLSLTGATATALASTALTGVFAEGSPWWRWALAGVVGVLLAVLLARRLRLPEPLVLLAGAAGLTVVLTALAVPDAALLGLLPGPDALLALNAVLVTGRDDVATLAVPVPATPGLLAITALGVGAVALVVDHLAAGWRRPALAGVPLLALLVVPSGLVPGGVGSLPFALAASGWLALLLADGQSRAARWGRVVTGPGPAARAGAPDVRGVPAARPALDPRGHAGRRIGVAALGLSLVAPLLVPTALQGRLRFGDGWGAFGSVGSASVDTYNPIVRLKGELTRPEDRPVLRVRTTDPDYLRLTALDLYDGSTWSQSPLTAPRSQRVSDGVPLPAGLSASSLREATATVEVLDLTTRWLPVHYPPREVDVRGDWRYDGASRTVFSSRDETTGLPPYTVTSGRVEVDADALDGAPRRDEALQPFLELPVLPNSVVAEAERLTADAENGYEKAVALQEYFRAFTYDERVPEGNSGNDLVDFLRGRRGYCEQFAAAFAVMARVVDLPSRVAIGYTAGQQIGPDLWEVSSHDAHAWPEVHLPGAGWIRFEPTPRDDQASPAPPYSIPPEPVAPAPLPSLPAPAPGAGAPAAPQQAEGAFTGGSAPGEAASDSRAGWVVLGVLGAVALAATPAAVHAVRQRRAWAAPRPSRRRGSAVAGAADAAAGAATAAAWLPGGSAVPPGAAAAPEDEPDLARHRAEVAWRQVRDCALDLGLPWRDSDAPRAAGARLVREVGLGGGATGALDRLASAVEVARYSRRYPQAGNLRGDVGLVRDALRARVSRRVRWRAALLPMSTLRAAGRTVGSRVADLLDVLDDAGTRVRAAVSRRAERLARG